MLSPFFAALRSRLDHQPWAQTCEQALWETRGYPPGCQRVASSSGDRLECLDP